MDPGPAVARRPVWEAVIEGRVSEVQTLLTSEVDINSKMSNGLTLLQTAAHHDRDEVIRFLIGAGAIVDLADETQWTPLHIAVFEGAKQAVSALIKAGADVELRDDQNYTALHRAVSRGDIEIAQELIKARALVDAQTDLDKTPLRFAVEDDRLDMVVLLIEAGADPNLLDHLGWNPFHMAAMEGHKDVAEALLAKCPRLLESRTKNDSTALHLAAESGCISVVSFLLDAGAQIDTQSSTWTALHLAAREGHGEVVRLLLEQNADPESKLDDGRTALHLAAAYNRESVAKVLVAHNQQLLKAIDDVNSTPLHMAVILCHQTMVELLLQMGADPNTRDVYWRSPAEYASNNATLWNIFSSRCSNIQAPPSEHEVIEHLQDSIRQMNLRLASQGQRSNHQIYDVLGHLYVLLGQDEEAMNMFSQVGVHRQENDQISCSFCTNADAIKRTRFVCRTCPYVDICGKCYGNYRGCPLEPDLPHKLIRVPDPTSLPKVETDSMPS